MNIPPLISRTPPPISGVVDDEDEEDDEDPSLFPSLDFCTPKSPDKSSDELPVVGCLDSFNNKEEICLNETTYNDLGIKNQSESEITEVPQVGSSPCLSSKGDVDEINSSSNSNEVIPTHNCLSQDASGLVGQLDEKANQSASTESLNNVIYDSVKEYEDFSNFQSCIVDDGDDASHMRSELFTFDDENTKENVDDNTSSNNYPVKIIDEKDYSETIVADVILDESETNDIEVIDLEKKLPEEESISQCNPEYSKSCYCVDECSCLEFNSNSINYIGEKSGYESNFDEDTEFGDYKFESALPKESCDQIYQDQLSSQLNSECTPDHVNSGVTKETKILSISTCQENSILTTKHLEVFDSFDLGNSSDTNKSISIAPLSEPVPAEFSATFPDENFQSYQPTDPCEDDEFSDFVECTYEPCAVPEKKPPQPLESYHVFSEFAESNLSPILLLCLKEEVNKTTVWNKLSSLENTPALNYRWGSSYSSSRLLSALKIDSRNILSGHWTKATRKQPCDDFQGGSEHSKSFHEINFNKATVPHPQFEWVGSGLINPLDDGLSRVKKASIAALSNEAERLISSFPDLSYLKESFIVFPKNIN